MAPAPTPPALQEAIHSSTSAWQAHLHSLFKLAKDRFPDVVWELLGDENDMQQDAEEVWGHKAIVYARAPPSFQARYFSFRPAPIASPTPYSSSPNGTINGQSALSLSLGPDFPDAMSRSMSPYRAGSPSPSANIGGVLRLPTSINSTLFENELEYLYTGKGFGAAFEFLFDTSESREEGDAEESRIDKLRKDLVFMWRSRLYSDIRIALNGNFASTNHETATAIFSSHRFILVSRSPYFQAQLLSWGVTPKPGEPLTLTLPSPPFTPASLHFTLGFIYTGTLVFSHRSYDLDTAFHIMRSATYLSIDSLYDEIQARIVQEMMHGLFHAFLEFTEYERITGGKWGTGGCRCRQCARRAPRVLDFAMGEDVKNAHLERGARRALVGLFGEGWCTSEFALLPQKSRDSLLKGLAKRTTPLNIFALIFAAQHAMDKLNSVIDAWADISREMILSARKVIDDVLCVRAQECFEQPDWLEIMESDGARFEDGERVGWVMDSVKRGLSEKSAGIVYQTLVSSILLRPHATDTDATMLPPTSHIRVQVEDTRTDLLKWLKKKWVGVQQEGGFNDLEGWAVKEISGEIEVAVEDLINNNPSTPQRGPSTRTGLRATLSKVDPDQDSVSLRASVLSRNTMKRSITPSQREQREQAHLASSAASVKSVARSTVSTATTPSKRADRERPDSKFSPSSGGDTPTASARSSVVSDVSDISNATTARTTQLPPLPKTLVTKVATPRASRTSLASTRPKSQAPSVTSIRSKAPTSRTSLRPPSSVARPMSSRPTSSLSNTSDGSTTFKTANSEAPGSATSRSRTLSATSTGSNASVRTQGPSTGKVTITRPRVPSTPSATPRMKRPSIASSTPESARNSVASIAGKRSPSMASVKSTISSTSVTPSKKTVVRKLGGSAEKRPLSTARSNGQPSPAGTIKGKTKAAAIVEEEIPQGKASSETVRGLKKKESSDTIKTSAMVVDTPQEPPSIEIDMSVIHPRGATLDIGIPCIISSKRKRFKAYARYIGEVAGELGPWVGVEVPVGESWVGDKLGDRQWNDGTWGGVRYFDIGATGSEWDDAENDRAVRRRKADIMNGSVKGLNKREGDSLSVDSRTKRMRSASPAISDTSNSESRGLFVRPQQVLYVVDAVGADL